MKREKHNCEEWRQEGMGCSICSNIVKGYSSKDLKRAIASTNWHITSLQKQVDEFEKKLKRLAKKPK